MTHYYTQLAGDLTRRTLDAEAERDHALDTCAVLARRIVSYGYADELLPWLREMAERYPGSGPNAYSSAADALEEAMKRWKEAA